MEDINFEQKTQFDFLSRELCNGFNQLVVYIVRKLCMTPLIYFYKVKAVIVNYVQC